MDRDATLDAFVGADAEGEDGQSEDADVKRRDADPDAESADGDPEETGAEGPAGEGTPDPPVPTTDWSPEGRACANCGAVVERRWRRDDTLVCPECKDWDES
ncbi:MAG: hypothetical protein ABEJ77_05190 [Halanaeroarchaeum sp.]